MCSREVVCNQAADGACAALSDSIIACIHLHTRPHNTMTMIDWTQSSRGLHVSDAEATTAWWIYDSCQRLMGKPLYMASGSCLLLRDYQTYDSLLGVISVSWSLLTLSRLWSCCSLTSQLWPHYCSPWTSLYHVFAFLDHLYSDNGEALSQKPYDNGLLVKLFERFSILRTIHCLLVFRVLEWLSQKLTQKHFWL